MFEKKKNKCIFLGKFERSHFTKDERDKRDKGDKTTSQVTAKWFPGTQNKHGGSEKCEISTADISPLKQYY